MPAKRAGIMTRVSTPGQKDNSSPEGQEKRCREYARKMGYQVVTVVFENMSGSLVLARSKFKELCEMGDQGELDVILADVPDRLGRGDALVKLTYIAEMHGLGIEFASVEGNYDPDTIEGLIMKGSAAMISGVERLNIRRRLIGGKRDVIDNEERVIANRYRPYGYKYVSTYNEKGKKTDCWFEIVPEEAEIVIKMYDWCIQGLSTNRIAAQLNEMGVPTMRGTGKKLWRRNSVYGILTSTIYYGLYQWGKGQYKQVDTLEGARSKFLGKNPNPHTIENPERVPPLIDKTTWDAAQKQLELNTQKFYKPTKNYYLLRGRVICALCNRRMVGISVTGKGKTTKGAVTRYYVCPNSRGSGAEKTCISPNVRADEIERMVWEELLAIMQDEEKLRRFIRTRRSESERANKLISDSMASAVAQIQEAEDANGRLLTLYEKGKIKEDEYDKRVEVNNREKERLGIQLEGYQSQLAEGDSLSLSEEQEEALMSLRKLVCDKMNSKGVTVEQQMELLNLLRVQVLMHAETGEAVLSGVFEPVELARSFIPKSGGKGGSGASNSDRYVSDAF